MKTLMIQVVNQDRLEDLAKITTILYLG